MGRWQSYACVACLVLGGCAASGAGTASIDAAPAISVVDDRFRPEIEVTTGIVETATPLGVGRKRLLAHIDRKTGAVVRTVLAFEIGYTGGGRRSYEQASDAHARPLRLSKVARNSHCERNGACSAVESLLIEIPEADLRNTPAEGYALKLFARNGPDAPIVVPRPLVTALLARLDAERTRLAAKPPTPSPPR